MTHSFDRTPPNRAQEPWETPDNPDVSNPRIKAPAHANLMEPPKGEAPKIISAKYLMTMDLPSQRWVIPDLLPVGYTVFGATPKFGKSWLMLSLCLAITHPDRWFLGRQAVQGRVLYLALEDNWTRLRDRTVKLLGEGIGPSEHFDLCIEWPTLDQGGAEWLEWWIASFSDPTGERSTTVIIDTGQVVRPPSMPGAQNWYEADSNFHKTFANLAKKHGVAIVLITHTTKGRKDDPFESIMGTGGVIGAADVIWVGQRDRGEGDASLHFTGRDVDTDALALEFEDGDWKYLGLASEVRRNKTEAAILEALTACPGLTPSQMTLATDLSIGAAKKAMWQMSNRDPAILYVDSGKYFIRKD